MNLKHWTEYRKKENFELFEVKSKDLDKKYCEYAQIWEESLSSRFFHFITLKL